MRYAMLMAGGSGTRLWPMSRQAMPKQLIPLIDGKSLLRVAWDRLDGLVPIERRFVCAGEAHRVAVREALPGLDDEHYLGEPIGRDTLNAVAFSAAVIAKRDTDATIAVFTADHLITPIDVFQQAVKRGYDLAESPDKATLVTFGIKPTHAATGYGYLQLGESLAVGGAAATSGGFVVDRFQEKPDEATAAKYVDAGPSRYLWNSGMFVWRAKTLMDCVGRYEPGVAESLKRIIAAWDAPTRSDVMNDVYPTLKKISIDYAVMEPASRDKDVRVAAVPMAVDWLDVGSWPALAQTRRRDEHGNALAAKRHLLTDTRNTLVVSNDDTHLIATVGCDDLIIVHTSNATLVCRADQAESIKALHAKVKEQFGDELA